MSTGSVVRRQGKMAMLVASYVSIHPFLMQVDGMLSLCLFSISIVRPVPLQIHDAAKSLLCIRFPSI